MSQYANEDNRGSEQKQSKTSMGASFWLIIILVFLFIAALNFVEVESKDSGEGKEGVKTEAVESHSEATKEAAPEAKADAAPAPAAATTADTAKH